MDLQLTKLELIEMLLNTKKEAILEKVRILLEADQEAFFLSEEQYAIIDKRREEHLASKGTSTSWDALKQDALKIIS